MRERLDSRERFEVHIFGKVNGINIKLNLNFLFKINSLASTYARCPKEKLN